MDCIFCKIVSGELPSDKVFEDDHVIAFRDLSPQAPQHILIIPRKHVTGLNDFAPGDEKTLAAMMLAAQAIAKELDVAEDGYRVVINTNKHGGQTVYHTHMHFLAGRQLSWPPG